MFFDSGPFRGMFCAGAAALVVAIIAPDASAQTDGTWDATAPGLWSDAGNWLNGDIAGGGGVATFDGVLTSGGTVEIDIPVTLSGLDLQSAFGLTFAQDAGMTGSLTLDGGTGDATLDKTAGLHTLGLDATLATNLVINNDAGGDLDINGSISGAHGVTYNGPARTQLNTAQAYTGGSTVNGLVDITTSGSLVGTGNVTVSPTGELRISEPAGNDSALNSVDTHSVVLTGGRLRVNVDAPIADVLNASSTGGTILLGANNTNDLNLTRAFDGAVTNDSSNVLLSSGSSAIMTGALSFDAATATKQLRVASESGTLTISSNLLAANNIESVRMESGTVHLDGANDYTGQTIIDGGLLEIDSNTALGAGDNTNATATVINAGGVLRLAGGVTLSNEKIILMNGGELGTTSGSSGGGDAITSEIEIVGLGIINGRGSFSRGWTLAGPITGNGDLVTTRTSASTWSAVNTYTGTTTLNGADIIVTTNQGFGTTDVGTDFVSGFVRITQPTAEDFDVQRAANLFLNSSATAHSNTIRLFGGTLWAEERSTNADPSMIVSQTVQVTGYGHFFSNESDKTFVLSGGIAGSGDLGFGGDSSAGGTVITTPILVNGRIQMVGGHLVLDAANVASSPVEIYEGRLTVNADQTLETLRMVTTSQSLRGGFLATGPGATVTVTSPEIVLHAAWNIDANLDGVSTIRKDSLSELIVTNLGTNNHANIIIDRGYVTVDGVAGLGSTLGTTTIGSMGARLEVGAGITLNENIILDNATGLAYEGATSGIFGGQINVAPGASVLSGALTGSGAIVGSGDVYTRFLQLETPGHTYTGDTHVLVNGDLRLEDNGAISTTPSITLERAADLDLRNDGSANLSDRIGDSILIRLRAADVRLISATSGATTETLGTVLVDRGQSEISSNLSSGGSLVTLTINTLTPSGHGTTGFNNDASANRRIVIGNPTDDDGILGGWAFDQNTRDFVTHGVNGIEALSIAGRPDQVNTSGSSDNVRVVSAPAALTADRNINSLTFDDASDYTLDLGGHTLNIESGGLISPSASRNYTISNGSLTAGDSAPNSHLYIHAFASGTNISAAIVDNAGGATSLVKSGTARVDLSGVNTYTGDTYVNAGELRIVNAASVPAGSDVYLDAGTLNIAVGAPFSLGDVYLRGGSLAGGNTTDTVSAQSITAFEGTLSAVLGGNVSIVKTTLGSLGITGHNVGYSGDIDVFEGSLYVGGTFALGSGTTTVHTDGRLLLSKNSISGNIDLAGGTIVGFDGTLAGSLHVSQNSHLIMFYPGERLTELYRIYNDLRFTGDLSGNATLTIDGASAWFDLDGGDNSAFSGTLRVNSGGVEATDANIGTGSAIVEQSGRFNANNAGINGGNSVTLNGGSLSGSAAVNINLHVNESSWLAHTNLDGNVYLADGTRLIMSNLAATQNIHSDLFVGGETVMRGGTRRINLNGDIRSNAIDSVLDLWVEDAFRLNGGLHAGNGHSLTILFDGVMETISLGTGQSASGNGSIANALTFADGGAVAPGASIGALTTLAAVEMGGGGVFEFEFDANAGVAGSQWDLLLADGGVSMTASEADPFVIRLLALGDMLTQGADGPVYSWRFVESKDIAGFDPDAFVFDAAALVGTPWAGSLFEVRHETDGLYLRALQPIEETIPTPTALGILGPALLALTRRRSRR